MCNVVGVVVDIGEGDFRYMRLSEVEVGGDFVDLWVLFVLIWGYIWFCD